jgi:hypothetical protein
MAKYWRTRPQQIDRPPSPTQSPSENDNEPFMSDYDRLRLSLVTQGVSEDWRLELRRYLQDVPADVTRDADIVDWWSVSI